MMAFRFFIVGGRGPRPVRSRAASAVVLLASLLMVTSAWAETKLAVLPVEGDKQDELVVELRDMLVDHYTLASQREVSKIYDLLKGDGLSIEDMENIAARTRVDYVLDGKLVQSRGGAELTLWVRDTSGRAVKKLFVTYKGGLDDAAKKELGEALRDAIDNVGKPSGTRPARDRDEPTRDREPDPDRDDRDSGWSKGRDRDTERDRRSADDEDADREPRRARDRDDDRGDDDKPRRSRRDEDDDRDDDDRDDDRDDRDAKGPSKPRTPRQLESFWAAAEFSVLSRSLKFTGFRDGFAEQPGGYKGSIVPGAKVEFEAFPLASRGGVVGALGVYGNFERALVLNVRSSQAAGTDLPTTLQQWGGGIALRFRLGRTATVQPSVGYAARDFIVDRSPLGDGLALDLPDVTYRYVDPGLAFSFGLGEKVALSVGGRFFLVLKAGDIQTPQEYGRSKITGGQGDLAVNIAVTKRVLIRLAANAALLGFDFEAGAEQTSGRDGDLATQDVAGARDVFISVGAGVGLRF
ncbi:MAG: hypothetical protein IPL79_05465 [Myxococcales bacterium]|nr:hypothetical protein [Myxococcales bacterium]